jgi:hypothetical protein
MDWAVGDGRSALYITYADTQDISKFDTQQKRLCPPIALTRFATPPTRPVIGAYAIKLGRISVDSPHGHVFVQKVRTFGVTSANDMLLALDEKDGRVVKQWDVPIVLKHLEKASGGTFLLYGAAGATMTIGAINLASLEHQVCTQVVCDDFAVSPDGGRLYYVRYHGDDAQVGELRLIPPEAPGIKPAHSQQQAE